LKCFHQAVTPSHRTFLSISSRAGSRRPRAASLETADGLGCNHRIFGFIGSQQRDELIDGYPRLPYDRAQSTTVQFFMIGGNYLTERIVSTKNDIWLPSCLLIRKSALSKAFTHSRPEMRGKPLIRRPAPHRISLPGQEYCLPSRQQHSPQ
jgi:hypothetical protein